MSFNKSGSLHFCATPRVRRVPSSYGRRWLTWISNGETQENEGRRPLMRLSLLVPN